MPRDKKKIKDAPGAKTEPAESETEQLKRLREQARTKHASANWLWFAVISVGLTITVLWGYSFYGQISTLNLKNSQESQLLKAGQENWNDAFNLTRQKEADEKLTKEKLAVIIQMLKNSTASQNSGATTTSSSAPSSTVATTSLE